MDKRKMTYRERIESLPWVDEVSVEDSGIWVYVVPNAHFPCKDGISEDHIKHKPKEMIESCSHCYRADSWREAYYAARNEVEIIDTEIVKTVYTEDAVSKMVNKEVMT